MSASGTLKRRCGRLALVAAIADANLRRSVAASTINVQVVPAIGVRSPRPGQQHLGDDHDDDNGDEQRGYQRGRLCALMTPIASARFASFRALRRETFLQLRIGADRH